MRVFVFGESKMQTQRRFHIHARGGPALALVLALFCAACGGQDEEARGPAPGQGADPTTPFMEQAGLMKAPEPDKVVAKVNGNPIRARRVYELAQTNKMMMLAQGRPLPDDLEVELLRSAMALLVDAELMIDEAREQGIEPTPEETEAEMQAARSQFATEEEYRQYLEGAGLTEEDVRQEAERRVLMKAYIDSEEADPVSEAEAREFYEENQEAFLEGEKVHAAQIWIRSSGQDPEAKREEARKRIEEVYGKLVEGGDFEELAKEYSHGPTAARGGDLGFFGRGDMVPKFENAAFSTEPGEFSEVFETPYGFHVVKVLEKREAKVKPFSEVKPYIMVQLSRAQEEEALAKRLETLRAEAEIEILEPDLDFTKGPRPEEEPRAEPAQG